MHQCISPPFYDQNSEESVWRRRSIHHNSKVKSKVNNSTFSTTVTSFTKSTTIQQTQISSSTKTNDSCKRSIPINSRSEEQVKESIQGKRFNQVCTYALRILYGLLAILLLTAMIVPSVLVYILAPQYSKPGLTQLSTYTNHCGGISPASIWQIDSNTTVTMIINTTECHFPKTPLYFVSILGNGSQYCLFGYNAIYLPTNESFRIYTQYACSSAVSSTSLLSLTQLRGYDVNWVGFYK